MGGHVPRWRDSLARRLVGFNSPAVQLSFIEIMFRLPLAPEGWYNMPPLKDGYMYKVYDTNMVPLTDEQKKLVE